MTVHIMLGAPLDNEEITIDSFEEDVFIGVDRGALLLMNNDYPLDIALGDFDSISQSELNAIDHYSKARIDKPDQDHTDFEIALELVSKKYHDQKIIVHNWTGGRLDHLISILFTVYQTKFNNVMTNLEFNNSKNTITFYEPGQYSLKKEEDKDYLSFITMTPVSNLTLEGVKYNLKDESYSIPMALISNEFVKEDMSFSFDSGLMMVIQSKDN